MSSIIGADAARLAGLQIDMLSKYRAGQLSLDHCERFLNLSPEAREDRFGDGKKRATAVPIAKFEKFADLGVIEVPSDYDHEHRLGMISDRFLDGAARSIYHYHHNITDAHFSDPSRVLKAGDRLYVDVHRQIVDDATTSEERLEYLHSLPGTIFTGAQGATLVWDKMRSRLPKGYRYLSFDEKKHLWKDELGLRHVPSMDVSSDGGFNFTLLSFEDDWHTRDAILRFSEVR